MNDASISRATVQTVAEIATPNASRYLQQLCKHFAHKLPVTFDEHSGQIAFPIGGCRLDAVEGALMLSLAAPDEAQMAELQDVVARHLVRFAVREDLKIDWRGARRSGPL